MGLGPVDVVVISFATDRPGPELAAAVRDVVQAGTVSIIDLLFARRGTDGSLEIIEIEEDAAAFGFEGVDVDSRELLSDDDVQGFGELLEPGTSAVFLVFENTWARTVVSAVRDAGGELALHVRIPAEEAEAALSAGATA